MTERLKRVVDPCIQRSSRSRDDKQRRRAKSAHYSPFNIQFLRNLIALPFAIVIAYRMGGPAALRSHRPFTHLARGSLRVGTTFLFFTSITYMGLAEATALIFVGAAVIIASGVFIIGRDHRPEA